MPQCFKLAVGLGDPAVCSEDSDGLSVSALRVTLGHGRSRPGEVMILSLRVWGWSSVPGRDQRDGAAGQQPRGAHRPIRPRSCHGTPIPRPHHKAWAQSSLLRQSDLAVYIPPPAHFSLPWLVAHWRLRFDRWRRLCLSMWMTRPRVACPSESALPPGPSPPPSLAPGIQSGTPDHPASVPLPPHPPSMIHPQS